MKISRTELEKLIKEAVQDHITDEQPSEKLNENVGDFMSRRELLNKARDAAFKFEAEIIKTLDLELPENMSRDHKKEYLKIMRQMERRVVKSVAFAIKDLIQSGIPMRSEDDGKGVAAPAETVNPGPGSAHPATPAGTAVTPHNRNPGSAGGL